MEQINVKNYKPNEQRMDKIANMIGIEINKPFQIQFYNHKSAYKNIWYKLTNDGLVYSFKKDNNYYNKSDALEGLLIGKHQVVLSKVLKCKECEYLHLD